MTLSRACPAWRLTPGANLRWHCWGDECMVHHALSNDSHRLSGWATELLIELSGREQAGREELASACGLDPADVDEAMSALVALDLVSAC